MPVECIESVSAEPAVMQAGTMISWSTEIIYSLKDILLFIDTLASWFFLGSNFQVPTTSGVFQTLTNVKVGVIQKKK